jgi:hypothetical protein
VLHPDHQHQLARPRQDLGDVAKMLDEKDSAILRSDGIDAQDADVSRQMRRPLEELGTKRLPGSLR